MEVPIRQRGDLFFINRPKHNCHGNLGQVQKRVAGSDSKMVKQCYHLHDDEAWQQMQRLDF